MVLKTIYHSGSNSILGNKKISIKILCLNAYARSCLPISNSSKCEQAGRMLAIVTPLGLIASRTMQCNNNNASKNISFWDKEFNKVFHETKSHSSNNSNNSLALLRGPSLEYIVIKALLLKILISPILKRYPWSSFPSLKPSRLDKFEQAHEQRPPP